MTHGRWSNPSSRTRSRLTRRQLVQRAALGAGALAVGTLHLPRAAQAANEINFWASPTLDIGDDGWKIFAKESDVKVDFTDNGNDPGPVVAKLAAGNANDIYDVGGLQGGSEKELAKRGLIAPWDLAQIPNYSSVWEWAKNIPYLTFEGKTYGIPTVVNADSMIALRNRVGNVDSYGVIFDRKLKGKTAMEDAWINSVIFTAIYLKNSENAKISEPGDLTADELGLVMEFLIKHKKDRQFRTFWNGWEQGLQLIANQEVWVMTGWEPIVYAARRRGLDCYYAVPKEGYEAWTNNTILLKGAVDRGLLEEGPSTRQCLSLRFLWMQARRVARICRAHRQQCGVCDSSSARFRSSRRQRIERACKGKVCGQGLLAEHAAGQFPAL